MNTPFLSHNTLISERKTRTSPLRFHTPIYLSVPSDMASELFSLAGQTALVTGGTRGIGQAVAIGLAEAGADIILVQVR